MAGAAEIIEPKHLPSSAHHVVVKLEAVHSGIPVLDTEPFTHEVISYNYTPPFAADIIAARIRNASIIVVTQCRVNAETLGEAPYLKCVITETTGLDHVDVDECRRRGITVMYVPGGSVQAVSEHALALYFATRKRLIMLHNTLVDNDENRPNAWKVKGSISSMIKDRDGILPHTCENEVVGIIGHGPIGQKLVKLCRGLGMKVLISSRKGAAPSTTTSSENESRVPFSEILRTCTLFFVATPLTPETHDLISTLELAQMRHDAVIVNVGRGGTINEPALLAALSEGRIYGAATDVYQVEPAGSGADSVLMGEAARGLNLTLTPHVAWCADQTVMNLRNVVAENVKEFLAGGTKNVIA